MQAFLPLKPWREPAAARVVVRAGVRTALQAEVLRVIDSMQLTQQHSVSTPANWQKGDDVIVLPSIPTDEARRRFSKGVTEQKPYLRITPDPSA